MHYDGLSRLIIDNLQRIIGACGKSFYDLEGMLCATDGFFLSSGEEVDSTVCCPF